MANEQAQTNFIATSEEDTSRTTRLVQRRHATRLSTTTKAKGAALSSD
jgi:hypothetical protein